MADRVTALEHRLEHLDRRRTDLSSEVDETSAAMSALDLQISDAETAYEDARSAFVSRAVAAYESGSTGTQIAMLLSAKDLNQMLLLSEANDRAAASNNAMLDSLLAARGAAEQKLNQLDEKKQSLLSAQRKLDAVGDRIDAGLTARRSILHELTTRIARLQEAAKAQAAASPSASLGSLLGPSGPAPAIPGGFAATGVSFEGIASWYGPGFAGRPTASGQIFDPNLYTAASLDLPLGTWLYVTFQGRGVVVLVNDRGPYIGGRVLDLSHAAAQALGISGLGWIKAQLLVKT
ncbi:MAG: septal ring lytic transglycosylase RlpA family protein [Actinobacteria bacterium]|nr:septal ring lytic transglycosylase RlpA family protein [Actinomycetota bacterium]